MRTFTRNELPRLGCEPMGSGSMAHHILITSGKKPEKSFRIASEEFQLSVQACLFRLRIRKLKGFTGSNVRQHAKKA